MKRTDSTAFDVIIVGGSYSGLAAAMALGRSMRKVMVIDNGLPCNRQTPHSHNFLTQDGNTPSGIAALALEQVKAYPTVSFHTGKVISGQRLAYGFRLRTAADEEFTAARLIFATGIYDRMPDIPGYAACWGISVLHCPYCHGYEVKQEKTGILGNGEFAWEFASLIANWTNDLTVYTNGEPSLSADQLDHLKRKNIPVITAGVDRLEHQNGHLQQIVFTDGQTAPVTALYARSPFSQHCSVPEMLGCELTEEGYLRVDMLQQTSVPGIYACGDNSSRVRTVANAVATGTTAGMMVNKQLAAEEFQRHE